MAIIQSGATADLATVDPVSNAIRVTAYRENGTALYKTYTGEYYLSINIPRFTAALAANAAIFSIRNGGLKTMRLMIAEVTPTFSGTAAASVAQYSLRRFTTATPTAGTALTATVVPEDSTMPNSQILDARCATAAAGLTTTGVVVGGPIFGATVSRGVAGDGMNFEMLRDVVINPNEGVLLQLDVAGVIGDAVSVSMYWGEY